MTWLPLTVAFIVTGLVAAFGGIMAVVNLDRRSNEPSGTAEHTKATHHVGFWAGIAVAFVLAGSFSFFALVSTAL